MCRPGPSFGVERLAGFVISGSLNGTISGIVMPISETWLKCFFLIPMCYVLTKPFLSRRSCPCPPTVSLSVSLSFLRAGVNRNQAPECAHGATESKQNKTPQNTECWSELSLWQSSYLAAWISPPPLVLLMMDLSESWRAPTSGVLCTGGSFTAFP